MYLRQIEVDLVNLVDVPHLFTIVRANLRAHPELSDIQEPNMHKGANPPRPSCSFGSSRAFWPAVADARHHQHHRIVIVIVTLVIITAKRGAGHHLQLRAGGRAFLGLF